MRIVALFVLLSSAALACAPTTPPKGPAPAPPSGQLSDEGVPPPNLPEVQVPPAPPRCAAFATDAGSTGCTVREGEVRASLARALTAVDAVARDAALRGLETCKAIPAGLIRALRAELAPLECADVVVGDRRPNELLDRSIQETLAGFSIAAKLERLVEKPPELDEPLTRARVQEFLESELSPWVHSRLRAVYALARRGAGLQGYGRGIVAYASSVTDARFVSFARAVPIPDELAADPDVKDAYFGALDEALDPYKVRSRDAGLVALSEFRRVGVIHSARLMLLRRALSVLFAGKPVAALESLWVPDLGGPAPSVASTAAGEPVELILAQRLPTFYAGFLLSDVDPARPRFLRSLILHGIPIPLAKKLESEKLSPEVARLFGWAQFEFGKTYWDRTSFLRCVSLLKEPKVSARDPRFRFVAALCSVLSAGPRSAAEAMANWETLEPLRNTGALDELMTRPKRMQPAPGILPFDIAVLRQLAAQSNASAVTWQEIGALYQTASSEVASPERKAQAAAWADGAFETAKAIQAREAEEREAKDNGASDKSKEGRAPAEGDPPGA